MLSGRAQRPSSSGLPGRAGGTEQQRGRGGWSRGCCAGRAAPGAWEGGVQGAPRGQRVGTGRAPRTLYTGPQRRNCGVRETGQGQQDPGVSDLATRTARRPAAQGSVSGSCVGERAGRPALKELRLGRGPTVSGAVWRRGLGWEPWRHTWRPPACGVARGRAGVLGGQRAPQPAASSRPTAVGTVTVCRSPSSRLCRYHLSPPDIRRGAACCRPPGEPAKAPHAPPSETAGPASGRPASGLGRPL